MHPNIQIPPVVKIIAERVNSAGAKSLLVGGAVRDQILGIEDIKDYDVEVYGLDIEGMQRLVADYNPKVVGKAFGVLTLDPRLTGGVDIELSLPRKDNKIGKGHKDFNCQLDPYMSEKEAALRRDLTMNSVAWNVLSKELIDHYGGVKDIKEGILRATNPATFPEDPLRGLRVAQFAARFDMVPDQELMFLCQQMSSQFPYLPKERKFTEFEKLLTKGKNPSKGLEFLRESKWIKWFPQLESQIGTLQNPAHHPEGDVWTHMLYVVDAMAKVRHLIPEEWFVAFCFGVMLHDVGKVKMTITEEHIKTGIGPEGKPLHKGQELYTAHRHDAYGVVPGLEFMNLLTDDKELKRKVLAIIRWHLAPYHGRDSKLGFFKRLAKNVPLDVISYMSLCDHCGNPHRGIGDPDLEAKYSRNCMDKFHEIGPDPIEPVLAGRDLIQAGIKPGPVFKKGLDAAYEAQMDDSNLNKKELLAIALTRIGKQNA